MSIINFAQGAGVYIAYGLSTDTKPSTHTVDSLFIETDTGNTYISNGSSWLVSNNHKTVKSVTDFPAQSGGLITLEDNITYVINGTVDVGTNEIVLGVKNSFVGFDKQNDILTGTTTGNLINMNNATVNKVSVFFNTMVLKCPNGTLFNLTSSTTRGTLVLDNVNISAVKNVGTFNNISSLSMRTSSILNTVTSGLTFTGTNTYCLIRDNQFRLNTGTVFAFGTATFSVIDLSRNLVDEGAGETFLSGTSGGGNVTTAGTLIDNTFSGAGDYVSTITRSDTGWLFRGNVGEANTLVASSELANSAVTNLSGTNTGDNSANTLYSGLAASKQDTLVSATNIKTINGSTILGSGDLVVGGSAAWGSITGTLSSQSDLQSALDLKAPINNAAFTGTFAAPAGTVTLAMQANVATATVFYRKTAATGVPEVQTLATLKTDLGLTGTNSGDQTITLTGNVTGSGTGSFATTIAAGVVTEAMQVLADNTTQDVSTARHGYVPKAPNNTTTFLRGDATWAAPAGGSGISLGLGIPMARGYLKM